MYVELGYHISHHMPVYPGLPEVQVTARESLDNGDDWNGTVLSMYLHAGTHVDAPMHFVKDGQGIAELSVEKFIYDNPLMLNIPCSARHLITVDELIEFGGNNLYEADILFLNTGFWKRRTSNIEEYQNDYPALSPEAAEFIRNKLTNVKAVAIDTLSIEDLKKGALNGYKTHRTLLDHSVSDERTLLIIEDYNPEPVLNKKMKSAFITPLRIEGGEAAPVNIIVEVE